MIYRLPMLKGSPHDRIGRTLCAWHEQQGESSGSRLRYLRQGTWLRSQRALVQEEDQPPLEPQHPARPRHRGRRQRRDLQRLVHGQG